MVPLVEVDGEIVSSTRIRALVAAGEVDEAMDCLGAPVHDGGRGGDRRPAGARARVPDRQPRSRRRADRARATASTPRSRTGTPRRSTWGSGPTFETGRGLLVESYLIDFDGDLYGQNLRVAFVERLRGEKRFPGVEELIAAMKEDVADAREVCARYEAGGGGEAR